MILTKKGAEQMRSNRNVPLELWVLFSTWLILAGWFLSAIRELNAACYAVVLILGGVGAGFWIKFSGEPQIDFRARFRRAKKRFSRLAPILFGGLFILTLAGALIYAPANYDSLTYRFPRVINWLSEQGWSWITTENARMNTRGAGFEWLTAPLIALTNSTRPISLINMAAFALLPGALFQFLRELRTSNRTAYYWMWILPMGYVYILQAASSGNDSVATPFFLASIIYGLKFRRTLAFRDFAFSALGLAIVTAIKAPNLPLGLPWLVAVLPAILLLRRRVASTVLLLAVCVMVSFLPNAVLNVRYCGDWTGESIQKNKLMAPSPLVGILGNTVLLTAQNLAPPFLPAPGKLDAAIHEHLPQWLRKPLEANFEGHFGMGLGELQMEEFAGLGSGVVLLLLLHLALSLSGSRKARPRFEYTDWVIVAGWVALAALFSKSALITISRVIPCYYPLMVVTVLRFTPTLAGYRGIIWRGALTVVAAITALTVISTPPRPLFPALTLIDRLPEKIRSSPTMHRVESVYRYYRGRPESLAPMVKLLPTEEKTVGLISSGDDPITPMMLPVGKLKLTEVTNLKQLRSRDFQYIIVSPLGLQLNQNLSVEQWARNEGAVPVGQADLNIKVSRGGETWYLFKLKSTPENQENVR